MPDNVYPLAYLITFTCYGTRLHGSEFGSVDRGRSVPPNEGLEQFERRLMTQPAYCLDDKRATIAITAMRETAKFRNWLMLAAHVGSTHVHLVIKAGDDPERVMGDMKSYASRALNRAGCEDSNRKRWTRRGSAEYLWDAGDVARAIEYVMNQPGKALASYKNTDAKYADIR